MTQPDPEVVDEHGACPIVGLRAPTLRTLRSRGGGPPFAKVGRRVVYRVADLRAWVAERMRTSTADSVAEAK
jgi:hypothetical protein